MDGSIAGLAFHAVAFRRVVRRRHGLSPAVVEDMVMSEMVERVARAMYVSFKGLPQSEYSWEDLAHNANDPLVQSYRRMAKAAIEAMRDPTDAMEDAGDKLDDWGVPSDPGTGNASALAHWHAMIDAALK